MPLSGSAMAGLLLACLLVAACGSPTDPSEISLGEPFELRAGASADLGEGFTLTFAGVKSDSRCPMDVMCVWAGDAIVTVALSNGVFRAECDLHTVPAQSQVSCQSYAVTMNGLTPYPASNSPIPPQDYVATLTVLKP